VNASDRRVQAAAWALAHFWAPSKADAAGLVDTMLPEAQALEDAGLLADPPHTT